MSLVSADEFRDYSGASLSTTGDDVVVAVLAEAHAGLAADVGVDVAQIAAHPDARAIAVGDIQRRAANLLARRNSPEGVAGVGDMGVITVPSGDPGSPRAVARIQRLLGIPRAWAV